MPLTLLPEPENDRPLVTITDCPPHPPPSQSVGVVSPPIFALTVKPVDDDEKPRIRVWSVKFVPVIVPVYWP